MITGLVRCRNCSRRCVPSTGPHAAVSVLRASPEEAGHPAKPTPGKVGKRKAVLFMAARPKLGKGRKRKTVQFIQAAAGV